VNRRSTGTADHRWRTDTKQAEREFWQAESCGEDYAEGNTLEAQFAAHARARDELEPYIREFAKFADGRARDVLEVGVGMGAEHVEWAKAGPHSLAGIDFTQRAIDWTAKRLSSQGLSSALAVADAEHLPFSSASFDLVYSWGVLHHTPNTPLAIDEVHRVLRPGGTARIMLYHSRSIVGYLLWLRYGLLARKPRRSLADIYAAHLESPGTQAFSVGAIKSMMSDFHRVDVQVQLSFADLLQGMAGDRHATKILSLARRLWPRGMIRRLLREHGLLLLAEASK
jgi:ubiquinone/menaquinone biosynthesis C-methylase UbiE